MGLYRIFLKQFRATQMLGAFGKSRKAHMNFRTVHQSARLSTRMSSAPTARICVVIDVGRLYMESLSRKFKFG